MPGEVTRQEFEARVGELVAEVEGEKVVSRYILEQTRRNGDDLAAVKSRLGRVETDIRDLRAEVGSLNQKVDGLIRSLPQIVADTLREVLRERDGG